MKKGSTRYVYFIGNYAIKTPSLYSFENFLYGLLGNIQEAKFSKIAEFKSKLCPVIFSVPFGLIIVMPKCIVATPENLTMQEMKDFIVVTGFGEIPCELKQDSFGRYNNKLMIIDYGS